MEFAGDAYFDNKYTTRMKVLGPSKDGSGQNTRSPGFHLFVNLLTFIPLAASILVSPYCERFGYADQKKS